MATKGSSGKGSVTNARVGRTNKPMGAGSGKGSGVNRRDNWVNSGAPSGGSTLRYRSGDVTRTSGSMKKYK